MSLIQHASQPDIRELIFIHTDVPAGTYHEQVTEGIFSAGELKTGDTIIVPAGVDCRAHWDQEHCYLLLALEPQVFKQRLGEFDNLQAIDLRPQFLHNSKNVLRIGKMGKTAFVVESFNGFMNDLGVKSCDDRDRNNNSNNRKHSSTGIYG